VIVVTDGEAVDGAVGVLAADWGIPCVLRTAAELFQLREIPPEIARRIVAEIAAKCGGATHFAVLPLRETIAVGVVCRNGVVGVVASIDRTFARFASGIGTAEEPRIAPVIEAAIGLFPRLAGADPARIVVYWLGRGGREAEAIREAVATKLEVVFCAVEEAAGIADRGDEAVAITSDDREDFLIARGGRTVKVSVVGETGRSAMRRDDVVIATFWLAFSWTRCEGMAEFPVPVMAALANCEYAKQYLRGRQAAEHLRNGFLYFA
jgi:hypothetical protein